MHIEETEGQSAMPENEVLEPSAHRQAAFNAGFIGLKGLVDPDPIDRYDIEQFEDGAGFIGFIVEQMATGVAHGAAWAFRRLRR